eukprot:symbB.v1.2.001432.t1/scaffold58.1/size370606/1
MRSSSLPPPARRPSTSHGGNAPPIPTIGQLRPSSAAGVHAQRNTRLPPAACVNRGVAPDRAGLAIRGSGSRGCRIQCDFGIRGCR